jgi:hypothetical protein
MQQLSQNGSSDGRGKGCGGRLEAEDRFIEALTFSRPEGIQLMLDGLLADDWIGFPLGSRKD